MNRWVRQIHRWTSVVFTLTVLANFISFGMGQQVEWLYYTPLPFLFIQLFTGLWLFVLPYLNRRSA
jgi:hypothetical protein